MRRLGSICAWNGSVRMVARLAGLALALSGGSVAAQTVPPPAETIAPAQQSRALERADAGMRDVLAQLKELGAKPLAALSVEEARRNPGIPQALAALLQTRGEAPHEPAVTRRDVRYPGAAGELGARLYVPRAPADSQHGRSRLPVVLYFHGGGWVIGGIDAYDASAAAIAEKSNTIVVAVEYRKAPEHRFPAAHEDALAAYRWVLAAAADWGGDPQRVALCGESAGGNLAANVAIAARSEGLAAPLHLALIYPVAGVNTSTPSYVENADAIPLGRDDMHWFFDKVLRVPEDRSSPMLDLVGRADLSGLPSVTLVTAGIDPLRSEGQALGEKLRSAGGQVSSRNFEGVTHEFFGLAPVVSDAAAAQDFVTEGLRSAFERPPQTNSTRVFTDDRRRPTSAAAAAAATTAAAAAAATAAAASDGSADPDAG